MTARKGACPDCRCVYLYSPHYDQCYECGRGVFDRVPPRASWPQRVGKWLTELWKTATLGC